MPMLFAKLPESDPGARRQRSPGSAAASVVVHGVLVTLAVGATLHAKDGRPTPPDPPDVVWIAPPAPPPPEPQRGATGGGGGTGAPPVERPLPPNVPPTTGLVFTIDSLRDPTQRTLAGEPWLGRSATTPGGEGGVPAGGGGALTAPQVEVQAAMLPGAAPRYPTMLRESGVEGRVVVRFVVDTTGRVERGSMHVVSSSHELFTAAVRSTLPTLRFRPASAGGRLVRQLVELPFEFALARQ